MKISTVENVIRYLDVSQTFTWRPSPTEPIEVKHILVYSFNNFASLWGMINHFNTIPCVSISAADRG